MVGRSRMPMACCRVCGNCILYQTRRSTLRGSVWMTKNCLRNRNVRVLIIMTHPAKRGSCINRVSCGVHRTLWLRRGPQAAIHPWQHRASWSPWYCRAWSVWRYGCPEVPIKEETMQRKLLCRRSILSFIGIAGAISAFRTDANAQTSYQTAPTPGTTTGTTSGGTSGMKRRQARRQNRVERRYQRRGGTPAAAQGQPAGTATTGMPTGTPPAGTAMPAPGGTAPPR